ncbi:MAG: hypothetical protein IPP28_04070 [Xanthomonadales bacterium]|nr:hypothetical protein [Xanthomonadales bacterium]
MRTTTANAVTIGCGDATDEAILERRAGLPQQRQLALLRLDKRASGRRGAIEKSADLADVRLRRRVLV